MSESASPPDPSLRDRVVIITGASRGFGWFIARALLAAGARVMLTASRSEAALASVQAKAEALAGPGRCLAGLADVRSEAGCTAVVEDCLAAWGRVDVLFNNAARGGDEYPVTLGPDTTPFWEVTPEAWRTIIDTNLTGSFLMTRAVLPSMLARGQGRIISLSTSHRTMVTPGLSPYGASKAGLEAAHVTWARELAPHGISVNVLLPGGPADTDFITQSMVPGPVGQRSGPGSPLLPGDVIVPPALYLCSDASAGLTGRRVVARHWDASLPPDEAFTRCLEQQHEAPRIM